MCKNWRDRHILLGKRGEDTAADYLAKKGYTLLERNWRDGHLELDIICQKNNEIFFIEVKTRKNDRFGGGAGGITPTKKRRILKAAQQWLSRTGNWHKACHFDVICLYPANGFFKVEHYQDAIELSMPVDSSHAYWQPW